MGAVDELRREYARGYRDALHRRETATWQLDEERRAACKRLRGLHERPDMPEPQWTWLHDLARALGIGDDLIELDAVRDRLIFLIGGDR